MVGVLFSTQTLSQAGVLLKREEELTAALEEEATARERERREYHHAARQVRMSFSKIRTNDHWGGYFRLYEYALQSLSESLFVDGLSWGALWRQGGCATDIGSISNGDVGPSFECNQSASPPVMCVIGTWVPRPFPTTAPALLQANLRAEAAEKAQQEAAKQGRRIQETNVGMATEQQVGHKGKCQRC